MKTAIVTGASRGIGLEIAKQLRGAGFSVIGCSSSGRGSEKDIDFVKCDISSASDIEALKNYVTGKYGRVDILVNNAGVAPKVRTDILNVTRESFDHVLGINLYGTFFMCQTFANVIKSAEGLSDYHPRIINISSCSAYASSVQRGEYCISKAAIAMTTQLFAHRLSEYKIPVFEVRPGVIETDMTEGVMEKYQSMIDSGLLSIDRIGKPEDVAKCVASLAGGSFDYCTGQIINADGGFHIRRL